MSKKSFDIPGIPRPRFAKGVDGLAREQTSEPHTVSKGLTPQAALDDIVGVLAKAQRMMPRALYLDLLIRAADHIGDRTDTVHEEIKKEQHQDRDG